jgi:3'-phosphoadenosine 5'-phosphosulfate sulfotransferase (PAPS reductase)/FAD synthetase
VGRGHLRRLDLVLAASFEDVVLIDLATKVAPDIEVIFLDTEAHFPETWPSSRRCGTATG